MMSVRLKAGVNPEELRKFGFKTGKEWAEAGERCLGRIPLSVYHNRSGHEYQYEWYHKFLMDSTGEHILYADEEYDQPMVQISVRSGGVYHNDIYVECTPSGTYHIGGDDVDIVLETMVELTQAGLLEVVNE